MDAPRKRPAKLECEPESQRLLVERIARLIDPGEWAIADYYLAHELPESAAYFTEESMAAARRVTDGLHLDIISSRHSLDGLRHRYDLTGFIREDM